MKAVCDICYTEFEVIGEIQYSRYSCAIICPDCAGEEDKEYEESIK